MILKIEGKEFRKFIPLIQKIFGNQKYEITDYDKDNEGTYWFIIDFSYEDPQKSIDDLHLQFGFDPLILATHSIDEITLDIELDDLYVEIMKEIKKIFVIRNCSYHDIEFLFLENNLIYSFQIEALEDFNLPLLVDIDEVMSRVREIIVSHAIMKNQNLVS